MAAKSWVKTHRKQIITHALIVGGFLFFLLFLSGPLFARFEPRTTSTLQRISLPAETDNIFCHFDRVDSDEDYATIIGIAYIAGLNTDNIQTFVCLNSSSDSYAFDTFTIPRPDVTEYFADSGLNLDLSGFKAVIPLEIIKDGTYGVGILIKKGLIRAMVYTDMVVIKSEHGAEFQSYTASLEGT
ncbi:MAG: hypothetical protein A2Z77_01125 [Chloroflexi bacterium RBG_13_51_36]|nr:MAG: hypothetical protein A2Z77_01125 [Chloroflexi bacterium RBG_13_51_36]